MQYVLLTVRNNEEKIVAYDSVITVYKIYKDFRIRYDNTTIEICVFGSNSRNEFFQALQYLTCETDAKLLEILKKEGLLNEHN